MKAYAPGKLVLTGAYAVLAGAPAIVVATSRGVTADSARVAEHVTPEVAAALGSAPAPAIDAGPLFFGTRKIGLGASAAIVVASLAAVEAARGANLAEEYVRARLFDRARAAHAKAQGGGSGVDVAASVYGGVLEYEPGIVTRRSLPSDCSISVFACRESASTSSQVVSGRRRIVSKEAPSTHSRARISSAREIACSWASSRSYRSRVARPIFHPNGVNRRSALSCRSSSRYSARDVNIRYGSSTPFVTRSSIKTPR